MDTATLSRRAGLLRNAIRVCHRTQKFNVDFNVPAPETGADTELYTHIKNVANVQGTNGNTGIL